MVDETVIPITPVSRSFKSELYIDVNQLRAEINPNTEPIMVDRLEPPSPQNTFINQIEFKPSGSYISSRSSQSSTKQLMPFGSYFDPQQELLEEFCLFLNRVIATYYELILTVRNFFPNDTTIIESREKLIDMKNSLQVYNLCENAEKAYNGLLDDYYAIYLLYRNETISYRPHLLRAYKEEVNMYLNYMISACMKLYELFESEEGVNLEAGPIIYYINNIQLRKLEFSRKADYLNDWMPIYHDFIATHGQDGQFDEFRLNIRIYLSENFGIRIF